MPRISDELRNSEAHPGHPIQLADINQPFTCDGCDQPGFGLGYECKESGCGFTFHEECVHPQQVTCHPFFQGCTFKFSRTTPQGVYQICNACGTHASGSLYDCDKHYGHVIHPQCMKLKHRMELGGVELLLKGNVPKKCWECTSKTAFEGIKGWSYVTADGALCLHVKCGDLHGVVVVERGCKCK